jgi:hypothetical protein
MATAARITPAKCLAVMTCSSQSSFSAWSMSGLPSAGRASSIISRASFKAAEHIYEILEAMTAYNRGLSFEDIPRCG